MPKQGTIWFSTTLRFITRLLSLSIIYTPARAFPTETTNSNKTSEIIIEQGTYGELYSHLIEAAPEDNFLPNSALQAVEHFYNLARDEENTENSIDLANFNKTLTTKFINQLLEQETNNPKNKKLINWLLERKIKMILHFELKSDAALAFAKQLYERDPNNEYALNLLIKEELKNNPATKKLLAKSFPKTDPFYRLTLKLEKNESLKHYLSFMYLASFNQIRMMHPGKEDWRFYLFEVINDYSNAINLAKKDIPKVSNYYTLIAQQNLIYDYTAIKEAKLKQINLHLHEISSALAKHLQILQGEDYKKMPELINNLLELDPEFAAYLSYEKVANNQEQTQSLYI